MGESWHGIAAQTLALPVDDLRVVAGTRSFIQLGGSSLRGVQLVALGERRLGERIDVAELLGPTPLDAVLAGAVPCAPVPTVALPAPASLRPLIPGQKAMLAAHLMNRDRGYHLMFSLRAAGRLDPARVRSALASLTERHESLRTTFVNDGGKGARRVLPRWTPALVTQTVRPPAGGDLVDAVHAQLSAASGTLLRPFERPPVIFVLTSAADGGGDVLTLLGHHVVLDGWSVGLLVREFAIGYTESGSVALDAGPAPSPELLLRYGNTVMAARSDIVARLDGAPTSLTVPSELPRPDVFDGSGARLVCSLGPDAALACAALARDCGVTRTAVLLAAWVLVVARRCDLDDLLVGIPAAGRPGADLLDVVGLCTRVLPVRCRIDDHHPVADHLRAVAASVANAMRGADVPFEQVTHDLGIKPDLAGNPLVQVAFAAHDELVPAHVSTRDGLVLTVHEGHCGGAVFDAMLYVQRWDDRPRLALEYAASVLAPHEAADLVEALEATVVAFAAGLLRPLGHVRAMSPEQHARLLAWGRDGAAGPPAGLWELFEATARAHPTAPAVREDGRELSYAELLRAAEEQSRSLAAAGIGPGASVAVAVPRSAGEVVAVLGIVRLGAAYVPIDPAAPDEWVRHALAVTEAKALVATPDAAARIGPHLAAGAAVLPPMTASAGGADPVPDAAGPDPDRIAYVSFTSGSTGRPKGVRVPHRAVARLVADGTIAHAGPGERYLRLAPLAFDASTLELFAPLLSGASLHVFPDQPATASSLTAMLRAERITVLWLTAGLFRLVAEHRPDAFSTVRQLLTGGDVVPAAHVAAVLEACPGIRVTNGYGPTENTTFTTVHHVDDRCEVGDQLPIGRPIAGTGVLLLDRHGRPTPLGGLGEIHTFGAGLADGYAAEPGLTEQSFVRLDAIGGVPAYRTGDLASWDGQGRLRFLGRRDRQVKISGHRVEPAQVERVLRAHPGVADVAVVPVGSDPLTRQLLAAVKPVGSPGGLVAALTELAARTLPGHSVPARWAVVGEFPLTANGKLDADALTAGGPRFAEPASGVESTTVEDAVTSAWREVLGFTDFSPDDRFFEIGGDSLQLVSVRRALARLLPDHPVSMVELYRHPTVRGLAGHLATKARAR